jgi:1,4-dihydroxy-2-naphthoate octaprenyltransferase
VSPVLAGSGIAVAADAFSWWRALLALVVALALQVAVNYANDYSDGIRGTDAQRVGPLRLVGSGAAPPAQVRLAALLCACVAGVAGLALAATTTWWLIVVGVVAMLAAWFYTGGAVPYGYRALGEVSVFVFFGLVAVVGTAYVQMDRLTAGAWWAGAGVGLLACAILVANNLRDIPSDAVVAKRTLAVLLGDARTRILYVGLLAGAAVALVGVAATVAWWALLGLLATSLAVRATGVVLTGATGPALIPVLRDTGLTELVYASGLLAGCILAAAL